MKKLLLFSFLLCHISNSYALELDIDPVLESEDHWCWAACCEMIYDAYKLEKYSSYGYVDQYDIAEWAVDGLHVGNDLVGGSKAVDMVLVHYGGIITIHKNDTYVGSQIVKSIDDGLPIIAGYLEEGSNGTTIGHTVLIKGYTKVNSFFDKVIFNDPLLGHRKMGYDDFVDYGNWDWVETLAMWTPPREPIDVGIGPSHVVVLDEEDCSTEITESSQNLSYFAYKA